jgi:hypothetical protein
MDSQNAYWKNFANKLAVFYKMITELFFITPGREITSPMPDNINNILLLQHFYFFPQDIIPCRKEQLFAIDAYMPWRINAYGNLPPAKAQNCYFDIAVNYDCFVCLPVKHKHKNSLPIKFLNSFIK